MLMNVLTKICAMKMLSVLTPLDPSTAHALQDLKEMASIHA